MRRTSSLHNVDTYVQRKVDSDKFDDLEIISDNMNSIIVVAENIDSINNSINDTDIMKKSDYDADQDGVVDHAAQSEVAHKWTTVRTITVSGAASGSVALDGSENVNLDLSIADNSHMHVLSNISDLDNLQVDGGSY